MKNELEHTGFIRFDHAFVTDHHRDADDLTAIRRISHQMPVDHTDDGTGRARLYGRTILLPESSKSQQRTMLHLEGRWYSELDEWGLEYTQPEIINSAAGGKRRIFRPFPISLYTNNLIQKWTAALWQILPIAADTKQEAFSIGYHLIKLAPGETGSAVASPDRVHRDGEWITAAVLIERVNVNGGANSVTDIRWHDHRIECVPDDDVHSRFTLVEPMQGYAVVDDLVAHYVGPVEREECSQPGWRTILLIDFTPLRPDIKIHDIAA